MDEMQFDHWIRAIEGRVSRRGLSGIVAATLATVGLGVAAEAKKKKKATTKKKKQGRAGGCRQPLYPCASDSQCCATLYSPVAPICRIKTFGSSTQPQCCIPDHAPVDWYNTACCGGGMEAVPGGSGFRCCIENGTPDKGTPQICCRGGTSEGGLCCTPPGTACLYGDTCCGGGSCPDSRIC